MTRAKNRFIASLHVDMISQILCLHLTLLVVQRNAVWPHALVICAHVADRVVVVVFREMSRVALCLLEGTFSVVLSVDVHEDLLVF